MADNTVGATVNINVNADKLTTGVAQAKAQFDALTAGMKTGLASTQTALDSAGVSTNNLNNSTKALGETMSATGSRRELNESMTLLRTSAEGTIGPFELLNIGIKTFGQTLGGPMLVGITLTIGALVALGKALYDAYQAQEQLNRDAAALRINSDDLKTYTSGMKDLASQLMSVKLGMSTLSEGQVNLFKALGIDPNDADAGREILVAIGNEAVDQAEKIRQVSVAFGDISFDQAKAKLEKFQEESKSSANGWLNDMAALASKAAALEAGIDDGQNAAPTKGEVNGNKPNSNGNAGAAVKTQKQLELEKNFNDEMLRLTNEGNKAVIEANDDAATKVIAIAEMENAARLKATTDYITKHTELTADQKTDLTNQTATTNAQNSGAAATRAAKIIEEQRLAQTEEFNSEMAALQKAGADSAIGVDQTAGEKIIAEGQTKIDALGEQYLKDVANLQKALNDKKISQDTYNRETAALGTQFGSSVSQISDNSQAKAAQADALEQEKIDDQLQSYLRTSADQTSKDLKGIKESETQKIIDQGNLELQAIQDRYDKELDLLNQNLAAKKMSEQQYADAVTAIDQAMEQAKEANATAVAAKITAANNAPLNSLVATWSNTAKQMSQFAADASNAVASSLVTMMMTGKMNLASLTQAILADLAKIVIEKQLAGIIGGLIGGGGTGGVSADYMMNGPSTGMAGGGTVQGGVPIPVGERGPELFKPSTAGTIMNNASSSFGGGTGDIHIMMQNNGTAQKVTSAQPQMSGKDMFLQIMTDDLRRDGPISTGMQQKFGLKKQAYM